MSAERADPGSPGAGPPRERSDAHGAGKREPTDADTGATPLARDEEAREPGASARRTPHGRRRQALYSDSRRGLWAAIATAPVFLAVLAWQLADPETTAAGLISRTLLNVVLILLATVVTLGGLTLYAFVGLRGGALREAVLVDDRREKGVVGKVNARPWLRFTVTGGSAPVWSVQLAATSLLLASFLAVSPDLRATEWVLAAVVVSLVSNVLSIWVAYALHYARLDHRVGGLSWPVPAHGDATTEAPEERRFSDYLYLSALTQVGYSAGDVAVTSAGFRAVIISHVAIGFVLNAVVIVILVSVLLSTG